MNEQLSTLLNTLAEKLGVAADCLYSAMMKQVMVDGISNILWAIGLIVAIVFLIKGIRRWSAPVEDDDRYCTKAMDNGIKLIVGWVALVIFALLVSELLYWSFTAFYNPQYYIIHDLLSSIGN